MTGVYDLNKFQGQTLELGAAVWRGNLFDGCRLTVNRPPIEFDGNTLNGCQIELGPDFVAWVKFIRVMAQMMPEIKPVLRRECGLDDDSGTPPLTH